MENYSVGDKDIWLYLGGKHFIFEVYPFKSKGGYYIRVSKDGKIYKYITENLGIELKLKDEV